MGKYIRPRSSDYPFSTQVSKIKIRNLTHKYTYCIITTCTVICNVYPSIYNVLFLPFSLNFLTLFVVFSLFLLFSAPNLPKPLTQTFHYWSTTPMGRSPCCEKVGLKKGPWTPEEDKKLMAYIEKFGHGSWRALPSKAGTSIHNLFLFFLSSSFLYGALC